jgi:NifU-like protein involved in Fe-S cluster formation
MAFEDYSPRVMDHFLNPRNTGELEGATHRGTARNPACGDLVKLSAVVRDGVIEDVRAKTFGCAAAIAASSALTELLKGKRLEEARALRDADVVAFLGGLPEPKQRCSLVAELVLRETFPP